VLCGCQDCAYDLLHSAVEKYLSMDRSGVMDVAAYLRAIMRNLYIDGQRRDQRFIHSGFDEAESGGVVDLHEHSLEEVLVHEQEFRECWQLMSTEERELMFHSAVEEYTAEEIANFQGCSRGTILSRLHRIKAKVKKIIEESRRSVQGGGDA